MPLHELMQTARSGRRTLIMGILNVTPDSFSDGSRYLLADAALEHAGTMVRDGADIIDVGGESSRPATFSQSGARLNPQEELRRVLPVIEAISAAFPEVPISVDTYKSAVAAEALRAGACIVNDISALRFDQDMACLVAKSGAAICLMHSSGLPMQMPENPRYQDVVAEVRTFLLERKETAERAGIPSDHIIIDPGIGFGKSVQDNLEIMRRMNELVIPGTPLLVGASRKSTIGAVLGGVGPDDRLEGTAATVALAIASGAAIVRVHDVKQMCRVAVMADAIVRGWPPPGEEPRQP